MWSANEEDTLPRQQWWTISSPTKVTWNCSGMRTIYNPFASPAMTARLPERDAGARRVLCMVTDNSAPYAPGSSKAKTNRYGYRFELKQELNY